MTADPNRCCNSSPMKSATHIQWTSFGEIDLRPSQDTALTQNTRSDTQNSQSVSFTPHNACVRLVVLLGNTKVTPRENARKFELKNHKKTLDKRNLCFYDFLRDVFVARFSGECRTGARCLLGISRSWISGCKSSGSGTRAAGCPKSLGFFQMTGFFQKVIVVACESL